MILLWLRAIWGKIWGKVWWRFWGRLWNRVTLKHALLVFVCYWALIAQMSYRVPSRLLFLLIPWIGTAIGLLSLFFFLKHLFSNSHTHSPFYYTLRVIEQGTALMLRVFIYYSLLLYLNAKLDTSPRIDQVAEIETITLGEIQLDIPIPLRWANLKSASNPESVTRLLLRWDEAKKLWGGESVVVQSRRGFLRIPWIVKIERNEEKYSREALALSPTATAAWRKLINFYLDHERWKEASAAAQEYIKIYPADDAYALSVAGALNVSGHYADGIAILNPIVENRPTYEAYQLLGWALSFNGQRPRAAEVLEASIPLRPEDWEAYYHLGYVYNDMGKVPEAIVHFEKVLERRPHFPEVKKQLADLRHLAELQRKIAAKRAAASSPSPEQPAAAP